MAPDETGSNPGDTQRILAEVERIGRVVDRLAADWAQFRPVADAFQRGGMLAARTAARTARRAGVQRQGEQP